MYNYIIRRIIEFMKTRDSNLELLRIVSMFLIVIHHYAIHGSAAWAQHFQSSIAATEGIYLFLLLIGKAAVVAFVLIGAYFLSEKEFKLWRIINLCITTFIYSWIIFLFLKLCKFEFPSLSSYNLWFPLPIPSNYWFVIAYVYMLLLMPFMNLILQKCSKQQIILIIGLLCILWCILQFIPDNKPDNSNYDFFSTNNYFLLIYLIGGYIRKYNSRRSLAYSSLCLMISILAVIGIIIMVMHRNESIYYDRLWRIFAVINDPFGLLIGVTLFMTFKDMTIKTNGVINYISKSMFGVYLIHDNSYVRDILWHNVINTTFLSHHPLEYIFFGLVISICIFSICIFIDIIKRVVIDPLIIKRFQELTNRFLIWSRK